MPFEHIDPFTGNLLLTFTDLVLPGNAGSDLKIQRTYNSKIYKDYDQQAGVLAEDSWAGLGWTIHFGRVLQANDIPLIEMPDGSRHPTFHHVSPPPGCGSCFITQEYWVYDRDTKILKLPNGTTIRFDRSGGSLFNLGPAQYATQIADAFGNTVTIAYDTVGPADQITSVTQDLGSGQSRQVTFGTTNGALATMSYLGRTWSYNQLPITQGSYTGYSLMTSAQPPLGPAWTFGYDMTGTPRYELTSLTTPNGGQIVYSYVDISRFYGGGAPTPIHVRGIGGRVLKGRNILQGSWTYSYFTNFTTIAGPCNTVTYTFLGPNTSAGAWTFGLQSSVTVDAPGGGETETLTWIPSVPISNDPRVVAGLTTDPATYVPLVSHRTVTRPFALVPFATDNVYSSSNFNDYGRPATVNENGPLGARYTTRIFQYGFSGYVVDKVASETVSVGSEAFTKGYSFNLSNGFLMSQSIYGVPTSFLPDSRGNVQSSTDARGKITSFTYQWGKVQDTTTPEYTISRTINPDGTTASETRRGFPTSFLYDSFGRLTQQSPPAGNPITTTYDNGSAASFQVVRGSTTTTTYLDGFGRTTGTLNGVGVQTTFAFDACGRRTYESYPYINQNVGTTIEYDTLSRVTKKSNPDGTFATRSYAGIDVTLTDERGLSTLQNWTAYGDPDEARLSSLREPITNATTSYDYNAVGSLKSVSNPPGSTRTWSYNSKNQLQSELQPESGAVTYERDAGGNMTQRTDAKNQQTFYTYDGNNRLTYIDAPGTLYDTQITYDASDNRTLVVNGFVSTSYEYDAANRMIKRTDLMNGRQFITTLNYDGNDNVASITYPSLRTINYDYDAGNRPVLVREGTTAYGSQFSYHATGAIATFRAGNNRTHSTTLDSRNRVQTLNAGPELSQVYGYDGVSNVTSISDNRVGMNQFFGYDGLDRLNNATGFWGSGAFLYDYVGNRVFKSVGGATNYFYDLSNHLIGATGAEGGGFAYDLNGNMTQDSGGTYTHTPDDMLETATVGGTTTTYRYDADHVRALKLGGGTTYYVHGPHGQILAEYREPCPGQLQLVRDYIYVGDRLLAAVKLPVQQATISLISTSASVPEGGGPALLGVRLSTSDGQASACAVTVGYATGNGTAAAGSDYTAVAGTLTFPGNSANLSTQTVAASIINDSLDEDDETFTFILSNPAGAMLGVAAETVTIIDDDPPPTISIGSASIAEGNSGTTTALFTVSLSAPSGRTVTVHYDTADGTATTADEDYTAASQTLTFAPGTTSKTIPIVVFGDTVYEPDETFTVTLSNAVFADIQTAVGTGTINNDDVNCTTTLDPISRLVDPGLGGLNSGDAVSVTLAMPSCTWTSVSQSSSWLIVPPNSGATGDGGFLYEVAVNPGVNARTGFVKVSYRSFMVTQLGTAAPGTVIRVIDKFTGSNGTPITAHSPDVHPPNVTWSAAGSSTPTLSGGRVVVGAGSGVVLATVDAGAADLSVGVDWLVGTGTRPWGGLVLRVSDANNYLLLRYSQGSLDLIRRQGGALAVIGSQPVPVLHPGSPHRIEARAHADAIQVLWDGVLVFQVSESFQQTLTRHGLAWYPPDDPESGFDNFALDWENRPPVVVSPPPELRAETDTVTLPISATDPDGGALTCSASGLPDGLAINPGTCVISGTLTYSSAGLYTTTVTATDEGGLQGSGAFTWIVTNMNRPPTLTSPANQITLANSIASLQLAGSDPDGDPLTYSATGLPPFLGVNAATGLISGTLSNAAGSYVVTATVSDGSLSTSRTFTWAVTRKPAGDFDGDNKADMTVFRPSTGGWYSLNSSTNYATSYALVWGIGTDIPVAGDYDGDGKTDPAIFRPSNGLWAILYSSTNYTTSTTVTWGIGSDVVVPADYDGDGKIDPAIYRPSTGLWAILASSTNYTTSSYATWGLSTDTPVPGDYDGDGKADPTVYRPSTGQWVILYSSTNYGSSIAVTWGLSTDVPVPGDYDGDGRIDLAVYRPSTGYWKIRYSGTNYGTSFQVSWGLSTDTPVPGDYDGDGKIDPAIFRNGLWAYLHSNTNYGSSFAVTWGVGTDIAILRRP